MLYVQHRCSVYSAVSIEKTGNRQFLSPLGSVKYYAQNCFGSGRNSLQGAGYRPFVIFQPAGSKGVKGGAAVLGLSLPLPAVSRRTKPQLQSSFFSGCFLALLSMNRLEHFRPIFTLDWETTEIFDLRYRDTWAAHAAGGGRLVPKHLILSSYFVL